MNWQKGFKLPYVHGLYHVTYIEVGTLKQKHTQTIANTLPHAIYLSEVKIGDKWESPVDCYLIERWIPGSSWRKE